MIKSKTFFTKKKITYGTVAILVIIVALYLVFGENKKTDTGFSVVKKGNIIQEVSVSGTVKATESADLAFERSGRVAWINKKVGDRVFAGETIISLENKNEVAVLEEAEANLKSEEAKYDELKKGGRIEETRVKEAELQKAQQDLQNYFDSIPDAINDAYNKADNAISKQTDAFFLDDRSSNPQLTFNTADPQTKNDAKDVRVTAENVLAKFKILNDGSLYSKNTAGEGRKNDLIKAKDYLLETQLFLIKMNGVLNDSISLSDSTLGTYKDNLNTGRTNVNSALKSVTDLMENIASQKVTVEKTARELELQKVGATEEVLRQAESSIDGAKANIKSAEANLAKTILRSPIDGIVTRQDAKLGEIVNASELIAAVMSPKEFEAEAQLPEADLPKVQIGNEAEITLDAYGNDVIFKALVTKIDPAEKVVEGVSTYKITLKFLDNQNLIKSGMTSNITITTAEKEGVLVIPQRSVTSKDGLRFVKVLEGQTATKRQIKIGLKGSSMVEVISGLTEGEKILLSNASN